MNKFLQDRRSSNYGVLCTTISWRLDVVTWCQNRTSDGHKIVLQDYVFGSSILFIIQPSWFGHWFHLPSVCTPLAGDKELKTNKMVDICGCFLVWDFHLVVVGDNSDQECYTMCKMHTVVHRILLEKLRASLSLYRTRKLVCLPFAITTQQME